MTTPIAFRASAAKPCPVCGTGTKSCSATSDGLYLCRGEPVAGWSRLTKAPDAAGFHHYRFKEEARHVGSARPAPPRNWRADAERYTRDLTDERRQELASALGLPVSCLAAFPLLGFFRDPHRGDCWTFPEHGVNGDVTAISRRLVSDGSKLVMQGGARGVYLPDGWRDRAGPTLVLEGGSDTLAAYAAGLSAVGRPNDKGGAEIIAALVRDPSREVIVLGENDRKENGHWPGRDGAEFVAKKLAALLGRPIKWALPPGGVKDLRDWSRGLYRDGSGLDWAAIRQEVLTFVCRSGQVVNAPHGTSDPNPTAELIVTPLAGKKVRPVKYLIPGRVPAGKLILCGARGGSGKSTL